MFDNVMINNSYQLSALRDFLEHYTYDQFKSELQTFLVNGRTVWLVSGNLSKEQAIEIVEQQKKVLPLKPYEIDDLVQVKVAEPKGNHRVMYPIKDDKNESSCVITYFQTDVGGVDIKLELTSSLVMQYIS
jgi:secreted Zn-dependent insulinase-like peptidase